MYAGQDHTQGWRCSSEYGAELYYLGAYKEKTHEATYFLPTCSQAHILCDWGQPSLYTVARAQGLLSYMNISPQNSRMLSVPGQVGLTG